MTKYTKQAILDLAKNIIISLLSGVVFAFLTVQFGIVNVMIGLGIVVFVYCSYKYVKIQADINERLDKLNNK